MRRNLIPQYTLSPKTPSRGPRGRNCIFRRRFITVATPFTLVARRSPFSPCRAQVTVPAIKKSKFDISAPFYYPRDVAQPHSYLPHSDTQRTTNSRLLVAPQIEIVYFAAVLSLSGRRFLSLCAVHPHHTPAFNVRFPSGLSAVETSKIEISTPFYCPCDAPRISLTPAHCPTYSEPVLSVSWHRIFSSHSPALSHPYGPFIELPVA